MLCYLCRMRIRGWLITAARWEQATGVSLDKDNYLTVEGSASAGAVIASNLSAIRTEAVVSGLGPSYWATLPPLHLHARIRISISAAASAVALELLTQC